ncbi:uncharacterized protein BJX67DRAFT_303673 [Aspergillus lucknowensis]|uniref:Myb-like domain-containing protein n=1 Tax=Aspergillus lucknowensis TaxID=176173 RepID=A0ABR4M2Q9_9EURO
MHTLHSTSISASGNKSGVVESRSHWLHFKAVLHVFVGPDNPREDLAIESNLPLPTSHPGLFPLNTVEKVLHTISFDQQPQNTTKCEQYQMDSQVEHNEQYSSTPNGISNGDFLRRGIQGGGEQYNYWHVDFPILESGESCPPNITRIRSASQSPHDLIPQETNHSSPDSQFPVEDTHSRSGSGHTFELLHPVPKPSPYMVTSYFASEEVPATTPVFSTAGSPHEDRMSQGDNHLMRGSDWTSNDLAYLCLLQDRNSQSSVSALTVTEAYPSKIAEGTYSNSLASSWSSLRAQGPWEVQRQSSKNEEDVGRNVARVHANVNQQHRHFDQPPAAIEDARGLPWIETAPQGYIQPSSLLDPYRPICPGSRYPNDSSNIHPENDQLDCLDDNLAYLNGPRPDGTVNSLFESNGYSPYQPSNASRIGPWTTDARNALLIEYKRRGLSYKDIKRIGGFKEAESTLRGRFRALTKSKEQRVRKPQWQEKDIRLLCEAVNACSEPNKHSLCGSTCRSKRPVPAPKVPWKRVAQYIWTHGGSYHFGNATCKKKWCEVQGKR